ncbi:sulfinoalanine decarboxylase/sulfinoalanine decarboxylase/aspartate 1-decarboxylase [Winogradskyella wandonensis]|uniref:Sulfinoalanine decarboxylase/sulfinoalanine decarboxylase/aspartate 1-decarboxylase n=1 Tax=Winogradskyella wandonensis TaxID=1442586 RepID=A0A4R1KSW2_9FLAO|nr:aminotransferase class V-fold PLP-dependent enzyme [Winogradskyella wandonensis]TCK67359.1 sulfinoalanine decarboxylase/sulfinoalanine decarboxylase/aspartate 1-decarboxylase [Winogradskyella wandonensis]
MRQDLNLFVELCDYLLQEEQKNPVARPVETSELFQKLDLSLNDFGVVDQDLVSNLKSIIKYTPKTASTAFFNQLFGGRVSKATLGDLLAVMLNNSMYTYKVAGPHVGIEKEIINNIIQLSGYPKDSSGTLAAGGSMTNFMALLMARDQKSPEVRAEGLNKTMTLYTSEASHYSISKNAVLSGIGKNNVRLVKTNEKGEMDAAHLEQLVKKDMQAGHTPFFVNATAGTTVLGGFDDITSISKICKTYNLWLHVDGAYCGSVIFSERYKYLVNGLELSDSFSLNAHKMLGTPLGCSIIITKHKAQLHHSFSNEADYLYQTDSDDFNLGKISLQCGRRNDALKLWTLWKSIGKKGLEKIVDHQFELAEYARAYISNHPDYSLYSFDDSISVCFNYRDIPANLLCTALYKEAELMVGFGRFRDTEFVRMVTINTVLKKEDILNFFQTIEAFVSKDLLKSSLPEA